MKRFALIGFLSFCCLSLLAGGRLDIPLTMHVVKLMPMDGPTGSTPDPTDPNQFCASLTGNTLWIETQKETVSYVVIQSNFSEAADEDYFYALSTDSVSCPITRTGDYIIRIGHWNTDFVGVLSVQSICWYDFFGRNYGFALPENKPAGYYFLRLQTNVGNMTTKYYFVK